MKLCFCPPDAHTQLGLTVGAARARMTHCTWRLNNKVIIHLGCWHFGVHLHRDVQSFYLVCGETLHLVLLLVW